MKPSQKVSHILVNLPQTPGVYIMKDRTGRIIYVGKSVNLRSRVNSYWADAKGLNFAKRIMVGQVRDIEYIEARNEVEALVLETNLIKEHRPKYNILMKDDKNLTYIKITDEPIPEVYKTRIKTPDGTYFGPYTAGTNVTGLLKMIRKIFRVRNCWVKFEEKNGKLEIVSKAGRNIPCLDYYIGLCPAPCLLREETIREHRENVDRLKHFLSGDTAPVLRELEAGMREKAREQKFEEAAKIRDTIATVTNLSLKQIARDTIPGNHDAISLFEKHGKWFIGLVSIRDGEIRGVSHFTIESKLEENDHEILEDFLARHYQQNNPEIPEKLTLLLPRSLDGNPLLIDYLKSLKIKLEHPEIGPKAELLAFAKNDLLNFAHREGLAQLAKTPLSRSIQANILERLGYDIPKKGPLVFECYDISHTDGRFTVASRSVIVNGKPDPSRYRKYKIASLPDGRIDDFASMREVMERRTLEGWEQDNFPHLIIIDGGKGQLSAALEGIQKGVRDQRIGIRSDQWEINTGRDEVFVDLPHLCSLAKREEEVFVPNQSEPILFKKGSPELMLLQKIRDEAHRFAITFNRQSRSKAMKKNILEELPGFGPVTRKKLLKAAGSIENVRNLDLDTLGSLLTKAQIETLRDHGLI